MHEKEHERAKELERELGLGLDKTNRGQEKDTDMRQEKDTNRGQEMDTDMVHTPD